MLQAGRERREGDELVTPLTVVAPRARAAKVAVVRRGWWQCGTVEDGGGSGDNGMLADEGGGGTAVGQRITGRGRLRAEARAMAARAVIGGGVAAKVAAVARAAIVVASG